MSKTVYAAYETDPQVKSCLDEIIAVLNKHNLSLSHEDKQGGFVLLGGKLGEQNAEENEKWLKQASLMTS